MLSSERHELCLLISSALTDNRTDFSLQYTELFSLELISKERKVSSAGIEGPYFAANDCLVTVMRPFPISFWAHEPFRAFAYFFEYMITNDGYSSEIKRHPYNKFLSLFIVLCP